MIGFKQSVNFVSAKFSLPTDPRKFSPSKVHRYTGILIGNGRKIWYLHCPKFKGAPIIICACAKRTSISFIDNTAIFRLVVYRRPLPNCACALRFWIFIPLSLALAIYHRWLYLGELRSVTQSELFFFLSSSRS